MKINYKLISILLVLLITISGCNSSETKESTTIKKYSEKDIGKLIYAKPTDELLPDFSISLTGNYNIDVLPTDLKGVNVFDFAAVTSTNKKISSHKWVGIKLSDFLASFNIQKEYYNKIRFTNNQGVLTTISKDDVNDNAFLVFKQDGNKIKDAEDTLSYINLKEDSRYWNFGIIDVYTSY